MNILIFGPNGSGKGTQGTLLKDKFNIAHIESGVIFREHINGGTELGKKAKAFIERGELVPDDITIPMVLETLKEKGKNGWLLDGFPRSIPQAEALDGFAAPDLAVEIQVRDEKILERLTGRLAHGGRGSCGQYATQH